MHFKNLFKMLMVLFLLNFYTVFAATPLWHLTDETSTQSFSETSAKPVMNFDNLLYAAHGHPIMINPVRDYTDQVLSLPISSNLNLTFTVEKLQHHKNGSISYFGYTENEKLPVVITQSNEAFFARIVSKQAVYSVSAYQGKGNILAEPVLSRLIHFNRPDFLYPHKIASAKQASLAEPIKVPDWVPITQPDASLSLGISRDKEAYVNHEHTRVAQDTKIANRLGNIPGYWKNWPDITETTMAQIDVLVYYTPAAAAIYNGEIETRIQHVFAVANQAFADSEVYITLTPVASLKVTPPEHLKNEQLLVAITELNDASFAEVRTQRYKNGADLVVLFDRHKNDGNCGYAWQNGRPLLMYDFSFGSLKEYHAYMYSVVDIDCADYVTAHEIGHNLGLAHSALQGEVGGALPFGRGKVIPNSFGTIMAYNDDFAAKKVYRFSNPRLDCDGTPCGHDRVDDALGADAALALNTVRHQAARQYKADPQKVLIEDAIARVTDSELKKCIQLEYDNNPWMKYAGQLIEMFRNCGWAGWTPSIGKVDDLTGIEQFYNLQKLWLSNHNVADIKPLSELDGLQWLYIEYNPITDLQPLVKLPLLQILSLNGMDHIDNFSVLGALTDLRYIEVGSRIQTDISWISQLDKLTALRIYLGKINEYQIIGTKQLLKDLVLGRIFDEYPVVRPVNWQFLASMRWLMSVSLEQIGLTDLEWLTELSDLRSVSVSHNPIKDLTPLKLLSNLQILYLRDTQVTDVSALTDVNNLAFLLLDFSDKVICSSVKQLWRKKSTLELYLPEHCKVNDSTPPVFATLPDLVYTVNTIPAKLNLPRVIAYDDTDGDIEAVADFKGPYYPGSFYLYWRVRDFMGNSAEASQLVTIHYDANYVPPAKRRSDFLINLIKWMQAIEG